jgi:hypothetical protein
MICTCGAVMLGRYNATLGRIDAYVCRYCTAEIDSASISSNGDAPEQCNPCAEPPDAHPGPESALVQEIREWCVANGYRIDRVGQHVAKGSGNEIGIGDLLVRRRDKGRAMWLAFEAKTKGKSFTPAQRLRIENGDLLPAFCLRQFIKGLGDITR